MLGVRLDHETEAALAALARRTHRSKSDIAREAVRDYVGRHSLDAEWKRQLGLVQSAQRTDDLAFVDALHDDLIRDEPEYDWGDTVR